ncbi:MAG: hypothetical protein ACYC2P_05455 [Paludibacteraceae bacterium]
MKKFLLFVALATFSMTIFGQVQVTTWNFSVVPFGVDGAAGGAAPIDFTKNYTTSDGLTIGTDGTVNWTGLSTNSKTIDGISYTYRLQTGGGGNPVAPSKIPTTRYLKINVTGASTINIGMMSSSSSATRTLIIVNSDESVVDSIPNITGTSPALTYTYNYTGGASSLYLYSRSSGINYYYLSASNIVTSVNSVNSNKLVANQKFYDVLGHEISNKAKGLVIKKITYEDGTIETTKSYIRSVN